jgi:hypothetical protein
MSRILQRIDAVEQTLVERDYININDLMKQYE